MSVKKLERVSFELDPNGSVCLYSTLHSLRSFPPAMAKKNDSIWFIEQIKRIFKINSL